MPDITYSVSQVARRIKKSPQTVRAWTNRYSAYLSASAAPSSGDERKYTDADVLVLSTVAQLAAQGQRHQAIIPMISAGERIEISGELGVTDMQKWSDAPAMAAADLQNRFIVRYESRIDALEARLEESETARRYAEVGAGRLAGRLEQLYRRHWWQLWKPEKPEE